MYIMTWLRKKERELFYLLSGSAAVAAEDFQKMEEGQIKDQEI